MKIKIITLILLILSFFALPFTNVLAQTDDEAEILEELVDTLNYELEEIYEPYGNFVENMENSTDVELILKEFSSNTFLWKSKFQKSKSIYSKYTTHNNPTLARLAQLALQGADLGIIACDKYYSALNATSESESDTLFDEGDQAFFQSIDFHDQAVGIYNDYSGASSDYAIRNWLIFFSFISIIFSTILFFKSRPKSRLQAEIVRSTVYKDLFTSSLWMTGGLAITTVGYYYAYETGGTYYIFYGAIAIGGWQLLKGFNEYLTRGRKLLNNLATEEKHGAIKSSYTETTKPEGVISKKCKHCGVEQPRSNIVCTNCGENIL